MVAVLLYLPGLRGAFVWDDHWLIEANAIIRGGALDLRRLLLGDFWAPTGASSGYWRPLVAVSYALDGAVSHWNPVWFHAVNLMLHAGASAVAAALALAAGAPAWAALAGGLWFATLPAHVESVAWISGRTDVMCALLVGVTLLADARARARGQSGAPLAALAAFALALLAKETAAVSLAVLALAWIVRPDPAAPGARAPAAARAAALRWLAPYAAIAGAWLLAHLALTSHRPHPFETDPAHRVRTLWAAVTLLPRELAFALPWGGHSPGVLVRMPASPWAPEMLGAALVHLAFLVGVVWLARRRAAAAVPLALVWLALLPPAAAAAQGTVLFAERFLYLPSLGLAWALALAVGRVGAPGPARSTARVAAIAAAAALVLAGAVVTIGLFPHWRSDEALFEHMAHAQPRSPLAHSNWAMMLAQQARDAEAVEQIAAAQALNPRLPEVYFARALLHYGRGRWDAAAASADTAVALDSLRLEPRVTRALARLRGGHADQAVPDLERLLVQAPGNPFVESAWGQCLLARGRAAEAIPYLTRAARLIPNDPDVAYGLGRACAVAGRVTEARDAFARSVAIDPTLYEGWLGLATASHLTGDPVGRDRALERAAALPSAADGRAAALRRRLLGAAP